ncbi:MAG: SRPBCC family protein [Candidatus Dormiibacterota bacterium]
MSDKNTVIQIDPATQEVVLTRTFDAPRELVFRAYTDPQLLPRWWGPSSLTTTVVAMDVQPGGVWRFVQRDQHGAEFAFHGVYHEVTPPARLVTTFEYEGAPGHVVLETTTFNEVAGRTQLTTRSVFQSVEDRDQMVASGMEWRARESMERLALLVATG